MLVLRPVIHRSFFLSAFASLRTEDPMHAFLLLPTYAEVLRRLYSYAQAGTSYLRKAGMMGYTLRRDACPVETMCRRIAISDGRITTAKPLGGEDGLWSWDHGFETLPWAGTRGVLHSENVSIFRW